MRRPRPRLRPPSAGCATPAEAFLGVLPSRRRRHRWPSRRRRHRWLGSAAFVLFALPACAPRDSGPADLLLTGGSVLDGSGAEPFVADVAVAEGRIQFVGDAAGQGTAARDTVSAEGLVVVPGFIDMHSHAELEADHGRDARAFLFQGITTVALGMDGGGSADARDRFAEWTAAGVGVNAFHFVGHNWVRRQVMGMADRAPTESEMDAMRALVRRGMDEGAHGLSSGLFYLPGNYAETEEVVELNRVAAEYEGAIYDTHDRDLGAAYPPFGYLESIAEAIRIGEEAGTKVIFSHFNAQGVHNYGRAPEGAALVEAARRRGVEVAGAHHSYTATQSNLRSYTIPSWAAAGGDSAMVRRFDHPDTVAIIDGQTREMLAIRGGAERLLFADPRPEDMATYQRPHQYSRGTVHVLVNGVFAVRDGEATLALAGRALVRGGQAWESMAPPGPGERK